MDVAIGKRYFELEFVIEQQHSEESSKAGGNDDGNSGDKGSNGGHDKSGDRFGKRPKNGDDPSKPPGAPTGLNLDRAATNGSEHMVEDASSMDLDQEDTLDEWEPVDVKVVKTRTFVSEQMEAPVEPQVAMQHLFVVAKNAALADTVATTDLGPGVVEMTPGMGSDIAGASTEEKAGEEGVTAVELPPSSTLAGGDSTPALGPLIDKALAKLRKTNDKEPGSQNEIECETPRTISMAVGNLVMPERRSSRRSASANEDSLAKAERLVAKKNLEDNDGTPFHNSFLTLSDDLITDNVKNVGISLGSDVTKVQSSVKLIKKVEKERFISSNVKPCQDSHSDVEFDDPVLDLEEIGKICGDLVDDFVDDDSNDLLDRFHAEHNTINPKHKRNVQSRRSVSAKKKIDFQ